MAEYSLHSMHQYTLCLVRTQFGYLLIPIRQPYLGQFYVFFCCILLQISRFFEYQDLLKKIIFFIKHFLSNPFICNSISFSDLCSIDFWRLLIVSSPPLRNRNPDVVIENLVFSSVVLNTVWVAWKIVTAKNHFPSRKDLLED